MRRSSSLFHDDLELKNEINSTREFNENVDFDYPIQKQFINLQTRVSSLENQVKTLKKMLMLSVFKDKQEIKDFFSDVL